MRRQSLSTIIIELWRVLSRRRQTQFWLLLALMVVASIAEAVSIGAVLPFLAVLTDPQRVFDHAAVKSLVSLLGIATPPQLLLPFTAVFCCAAIASGGIRMVLLYFTTRYTFGVGADLSIDAYRRTLYQPYATHVRRNSSEIINGISGKIGMMVGSVLIPAMNLISSVILLTGVACALLSVNPVIALSAGVCFGGLYGGIVHFTRRRLRLNSEVIARDSTLVVKAMQEGLGGIRDVLINGTQPVYAEVYRAADRRQRLAQGNNAFLGGCPRFVIETVGMVLIAVAAYALTGREGGVVGAIPVLGALALGAQRLLPVLQQAYLSLTVIRGAEQSLRDALELLRQPMPQGAGGARVEALPFRREIRLSGLGFRYDAALPPVLHGLDVVIGKGQKVGFVGPTGSGKSTLVDIVMGLLSPTEGALAVDGVAVTAETVQAWQRHIAHVPQAIFLADASIEENIAFGVPAGEIDHERVREAARRAQIAATIEAMPEGYGTWVGERGIRLSGGQRQRVGIARALYRQADVIVFDEATSALDYETEAAVMDAIAGLDPDLTILIVAHRLNTLKSCDVVVEIGDGGARNVSPQSQFASSR